MSHLFISHSRRDSEKVTGIANRLKEAGHTVWLDTSTIQGGTRWQGEIVRGIEDADIFVLMLSPDAVKSENVEREVGLAYTSSKAIVPVMLHRTDIPGRLAYAISNLDVVDVSNDKGQVSIERVLDALTPAERTYFPLGRHGFSCIVAILISSAILQAHNWPRIWCLAAWLVLATAIAYLIRAREFFWYSYSVVFGRGLDRKSVVLSTKFKYVVGQGFGYPFWIRSEWRDPQSGKCHRFYSRPLWRSPLKFIPKEIRVIADPENFRLHRMDLSFLPPAPKPIGGVWKALDENERSTARMSKARQVFVSQSASESDERLVNVLIGGLEAAGYLVCTTIGLRDDTSLQERAIQQIQEAQSFVIVLSAESVRMDHVQRELDLALEFEKPILAAVLGSPQVPRNMAYGLAGVRRFDLSDGIDAGVARLLEAMEADYLPGTVVYKPDRLAAIRGLYPMHFILVAPFLLFLLPLGEWIWRHLAADYRSSLASWIASVRGRIDVRLGMWTGMWTRHDLRTRGVALRTQYKCFDSGRVVSQWRDPVSNEVYLFRSEWLGSFVGGQMSASVAFGLKTIMVYANPENLSRHHMDLPVLSTDENNAQALKAGNEILMSYSDQNSKAIALSRKLKAEGFAVFDLREMRSEEMIGRAEALVMVIPLPGASDLRSSIEHLRIASSRGKRIVPVTFSSYGAVPLSIQYALAGVQRIDLGDDLETNVEPLLKALGRFREERLAIDSDAEKGKYPVWTRSTGAWIGAVSYGFGSILPAFLLHGRSRQEALLGGLVAGLVCGACVGALTKPRIGKGHVIFNGLWCAVFGLGVIYMPVYDFAHSFIRAENSIESIGGEAFGATFVGFLAFFAAKLLEDRFLIRRFRRRGKLLLTEYRRFDDFHVVSEWCDLETGEKHVFQGATRGHDISKLVRTTTIAVFVNPDNFADYYMDFSFESEVVAGRPVAASNPD